MRACRVTAPFAVLWILVLASSPAAAQSKQKVILDTDIGSDIDDAWALGLALRYPGFELLGVTISDGDTPARAKVACKLLHVAGRGDVPVAVGRATTPPHDHEHQFTWAEDFTAKTPIGKPAAQFIVETIRAHPGEVTLMAVGPLQNVADALRRDPGIGKLVKRVVLMSGSIGANAWSSAPFPEWNVERAIADAQVVYSAGLPLTTVPLDSTTYVKLEDAERERLSKHGSPLTRALESLYRLWLEKPSSRMTLHDQLAIAETARPGEFFRRIDTLDIHVDDKGYTRVDDAKGVPARVAFEPKRDAFMQFYLDGLTQ